MYVLWFEIVLQVEFICVSYLYLIDDFRPLLARRF